MKEQYRTLWNWLLNKGLLTAALIINFFTVTLFAVAMVGLHYFVKWWDHFR